MNKIITEDCKSIIMSFFLIFAISKMLFFNTDIFILLKVLFSIYWLLVLPGFAITRLISTNTFIERIAIGIAISAAALGTFSYYLGIMGFNVRHSAYAIPLIILAITAAPHSEIFEKSTASKKV